MCVFAENDIVQKMDSLSGFGAQLKLVGKQLVALFKNGTTLSQSIPP
jgi:hypothetical protein